MENNVGIRINLEKFLRHPNLLADFCGFIYFAVSHIGEGAFLLGKEGCAEEEECGGFIHLL